MPWNLGSWLTDSACEKGFLRVDTSVYIERWRIYTQNYVFKRCEHISQEEGRQEGIINGPDFRYFTQYQRFEFHTKSWNLGNFGHSLCMQKLDFQDRSRHASMYRQYRKRKGRIDLSMSRIDFSYFTQYPRFEFHTKPQNLGSSATPYACKARFQDMRAYVERGRINLNIGHLDFIDPTERLSLSYLNFIR